jgi:hypothetical protein
MEFTIEFCTKHRPQKLLKIRLFLSSVRTEVSLVQTVFCDILSKTA